jgi:hypothetical protein
MRPSARSTCEGVPFGRTALQYRAYGTRHGRQALLRDLTAPTSLRQWGEDRAARPGLRSFRLLAPDTSPRVVVLSDRQPACPLAMPGGASGAIVGRAPRESSTPFLVSLARFQSLRRLLMARRESVGCVTVARTGVADAGRAGASSRRACDLRIEGRAFFRSHEGPYRAKLALDFDDRGLIPAC